MKILQTLMLGTLSCAVNIKCQPFSLSNTNSFPPAENEVDGKIDGRIEGGNGINSYTVYSERAQRVKRGGSFGSRTKCKDIACLCQEDGGCTSNSCQFYCVQTGGVYSEVCLKADAHIEKTCSRVRKQIDISDDV